jgi:glycosyltransferase involved in cell wall biosynthesis
VVRLAFDVTALHDPRTGVGALATEVLRRVASHGDVDVTAYSVSWRGRDDLLSGLLPPNVHLVTRPMAARPLRELWKRVDWPSLTWWTGAVDVVHGPNYVVPPAKGAATLMTVHDLTFVHHPELCTRDTLDYPALIRRALARGAHVHAVSQFVADEVIGVFGADRDRVHVIHNGVDAITPGDAASGRRVAGGDRYVLAIGTVEPRKDFPLLVSAFDDLAATDPEVRLVIAGQDGWGADVFHQALQRARHRDRVVRTGYVDDATRADLLAGAAVFAYPSRYEGFGLPPLEAIAAGVPVVTTRAGALPEVLGDGAVFVDPGDREALTAALAAQLDGNDGLVAKGRAVAARYSWDRCADALVNLYRQLC